MSDEEEVQIIDFDADKKKKKDKKDKKEKKEKKKKEKEGSDEGEAVDGEKEKKKKKKDKDKKKSKDGPEEEGEEKEKRDDEENEDAEVELFDAEAVSKDKKHKKKKAKASKFDAGAEEGEKVEKVAKEEYKGKTRIDLNNVDGHENYEYKFLLERIVEQIKAIHGDEGTGSSGQFKLIEPQCSRTKTKSTWNNFDAQVKVIKREHQHVLSYFMSELGCEGNIGSMNEMVLVGGYQPKHFLRLIRKYIEDYVRCANCKSLDSKIERDEKSRLWVLKCQKCSACRTVQAIQGRFTAIKRGQRRKERM